MKTVEVNRRKKKPSGDPIVKLTNPTVISSENGDKQRWDQMQIDDLMTEASTDLQTMFRAGYKAIKCLRYIHNNMRWIEKPGYEDKSFRVFLEDYFNIKWGTYHNMLNMVDKYGDENFDRYGVQALKMIDSTTNPMKTLRLLNKKAEKLDGHVPMSEIRQLVRENKPVKTKPIFTKEYEVTCPHCSGHFGVVV